MNPITYTRLTEHHGDPVRSSPVAEDFTGRTLVRVSEEAQRQARFQWPVALDLSVADCVAWRGAATVEADRLAALLREAHQAVVSAQRDGGAPVPFAFEYLSRTTAWRRTVQLTVRFGHDGGAPLVVIAESTRRVQGLVLLG
ncbi:hypothetical protein ABT093_19660 [Kitasatospora sp. NPDC002551]|uniref:hypothetical protein n=1 Tax=Kitasatospora sp. NPDC002551 TaxID=3154539 RepID=UPI0033191C17